MDNNLLPETVYENLPDSIKELFNHFEEREKDITLLASLTVLSSCIPNVYGIYGNHKVYSNLYLMIIAPPASGKGVMNHTLGLIEKIHLKIYEDSKGARKLAIKDKEKNIPQIQVKTIPANISTAELYSLMNRSNHGNLIFETEADTLSILMKNDWGNFSDVLRKAFHHETISISRKMDDILFVIKEPKLSLAMTGTPNQLKPLIESKENGLFSRFIYYKFDTISEWKHAFSSSINKSTIFNQTGNEIIFNLYSRLASLNREIEFKLTTEQQDKSQEELKSIHDIILADNNLSFLSNVKRHGIIHFRICMILTLLRNEEEIADIVNVECSDIDFEIALTITKTLLRHSYLVFKSLGIAETLPQVEIDILNKLDSTFERIDVINHGTGLSTRTLDKKLKEWISKRIIKKLKHGHYEKL